MNYALHTIIVSTFVVSILSYFFVPTTYAYYTNMPASVVIGQQDFNANTANQGSTPSERTVAAPSGIIVVQNKVIVADASNRRVLIYNNIPTSNNIAADVVIGQPDFTSNQAYSAGPNTLNTLSGGLSSNGKNLIITDTNRVLIYNTIPTSNNASADVVVGQINFTDTLANQGGSVNANTLSGPRDVYTDGTKLFISDTGNQRILIYNSIPTSNNASADVVIAQTTFTTTSCPQIQCLHNPGGIFTDQGKLYIADQSNGRILIYNSIPTTNGAIPDVVVGKDNMASLTDGNEAVPPGPNRLTNPRDVHVDSGRLFIADWSNSRILIYNSVPTEYGRSADLVIGQSNFNDVTANQGLGTQAHTIRRVGRIHVYDNKLFVADSENHRVLIYDNSLPNLSIQRTITGQSDGKLRFSGTANTNLANQTIKQIEYSLNGSTWTGGFASDGTFDSSREEYYFDFDPSVNTMAGDEGYTVKIRATHNSDKDAGTSTLYFEPFQSLSPANNSFTLNRLPTFSFTIQKTRFQDLKDNLDRFTISLSTDGVNFRPYIDHIPVDYNFVRLHPDNVKPNKIDEMNGLYEDKFKTVSYTEENSHITVTPKGVDREGNSYDKFRKDGGTLLENNVYYWRVEALDKAGQVQFTDTKTLRVGTYQTVTSRTWFPLALQFIGGNQTKQQINVSTTQPHVSSEALNIDSRWPWFKGIATAGSTVRLILKKDECKKDLNSSYYTQPILNTSGYCTRLYETTTLPNSTFSINIPWELIPDTYEVSLSVNDTGDNYNELPPFLLTITDNSY